MCFLWTMKRIFIYYIEEIQSLDFDQWPVEWSVVTRQLAVVNSSNQTLPLVEEEAPVQNRWSILEWTKIWSWVPTGPETKYDFAGEGQQQFPRCDSIFKDNDSNIMYTRNYNVPAFLTIMITQQRILF
jgi:hypothetical protein